MSATVDQIADDGDCAAMLSAMADVYQRYGRDAIDVAAPLLPSQSLPAHDAPVGALS